MHLTKPNDIFDFVYDPLLILIPDFFHHIKNDKILSNFKLSIF